VALLREGGVERLSLDLILAIPGQDLDEQAHDLERAARLSPDHVSAYVLTYEEGTVFTRRMRQGRLPAPRPERELRHLHLACERLAAVGLARYEISNFARPGQESRHNLAYWRDAQWLGLGAGAHGHGAGRRWKNVDDPAEYVARVRAGEDPQAWSESVPAPLRLFESLMMGLRLLEGVDLARLGARHGLDARARYADVVARHRDAGLLVQDGDRIALSERGLDVANHVLADFWPADVEPGDAAADRPQACS
jgi:oxygen-independent coproporphyrinogen-3 oxidase